jgi:hypothetical protein
VFKVETGISSAERMELEHAKYGCVQKNLGQSHEESGVCDLLQLIHSTLTCI